MASLVSSASCSSRPVRKEPRYAADGGARLATCARGAAARRVRALRRSGAPLPRGGGRSTDSSVLVAAGAAARGSGRVGGRSRTCGSSIVRVERCRTRSDPRAAGPRATRIVVDAKDGPAARRCRREDAKAATCEVYRVVLPEEAPAGGAWTLVVATRAAAVGAAHHCARRRQGRQHGAAGAARVAGPARTAARRSRPRGAAAVRRCRDRAGDRGERRASSSSPCCASRASAGSHPTLPRRRFRACARGSARSRAGRCSRSRGRRRSRRGGAARDQHGVRSPRDRRRRAGRRNDAHSARDGSCARRCRPTPAACRGSTSTSPRRGDHLRLTIEDGDSPPLADVAVALAYDAPALLFALPAGTAGSPSGVLRFGGGRALRAALRRRGAAARCLERERRARRCDAHPAGAARRGAAQPGVRRAPGAGGGARPGAAVEVDAWQWQRPLTIPESPEGLVELRLGAEDVGARADRADLRVVDGDGRQWPYVGAPPYSARALLYARPVRRAPTASRRGRSRCRPHLWCSTASCCSRRDLCSTDVSACACTTPTASRASSPRARWRRICVGRGLCDRLSGDAGRSARAISRWSMATMRRSSCRASRRRSRCRACWSPPRRPPLPSRCWRAILDAGDAALRDRWCARAGARSAQRSGAGGRRLATTPDWTGTPGGSARRRAWLQQIAIWGVIVLAVKRCSGWSRCASVRQG